MTKRFFIFGAYNTWYDWRLLLTAKEISKPDIKLYQVDIDGRHGTLDLTEALTGEVTYTDRILEASFSASEGTYAEREFLLRNITALLHGRQVNIIEPDDPEHYYIGRVQITSAVNTPAYATLTLEATCEPWRYALEETIRTINVVESADVVVHNNGVKTLCPVITTTGNVALTYGGITTSLEPGSYKINTLKLVTGANVIHVTGNSTVTLSYTEAEL